MRAIRDLDGRVTKYTALMQRPPGFNPPSDLWFAVYDSRGELARDDGGAPMQGRALDLRELSPDPAGRRFRVRRAGS